MPPVAACVPRRLVLLYKLLNVSHFIARPHGRRRRSSPRRFRVTLANRGEAHVLERASQPLEQLAQLTWAGFFLDNLLPVTLGNLVGGVVMVAAVYWFVYLRGRPGNRVAWTWQHHTHPPVEAGRTTNDRAESHHQH
jgi:hypothetical protein